MAEYLVRPYREGDEAAINDGFNRAFGLRRPLEEWRWKFAAGPEGRWIMLTFDGRGQTLLAHYAAVAARFKVGDLVVRAGQPCDVYALPEARSTLAAGRAYLDAAKGFFDTFGGIEKLALLYGFPGAKALRLGVARLGYDQMPPQPVVTLTRPSRFRGRLLTRHRVRSGFEPRALDELWARSRGRYEVAVERDSAWFARRFTGRPDVSYLHLSAWSGHRVGAWAVQRLGEGSASLADLVWDGEDVRALAALDRVVARLARDRAAPSVGGWMMGDDEAASSLTGLGWEPRPHPAGLVVVARSFHPGIDPSGFPGRFYVTIGDSDLV